MKKLILTALSYLLFVDMVLGLRVVDVQAEGLLNKHVEHATKQIELHTEPKFRNTFMVFSDEQIECLAMNVYHEARNESLSGKIAVIIVTMNRVTDKRFPESICKVVHQGKHYYSKKSKKYLPHRDRCQFSWYCDGRSDKPKNNKAWAYSLALTEYFLKRSMQLIDFTEGATHYHADWMEKFPRWSKRKNFVKTVKIDTHLFYRWENPKLLASR